jgi:hypothetical protein
VAAKGDNSDNAHACQQGGHETRFEAETGRPFKNAGDCTSHGAQGGASSLLQFLTLPTYPLPCGNVLGRRFRVEPQAANNLGGRPTQH